MPDISPSRGGDWLSHRLSPIFSVAEWAAKSKLPISPLEREMSGRPEGGHLARRWFVGAP
ncbi:MAG: propionyl-coenzyme A carboxylase alpha polypeptide [Mesorhizobium sp.]|nr:MAG: propionyl-coenzyme A carboxylase alpha polypeptide [Mesorhizobium sp.]